MADRVRMRWTKRREARFLSALAETCNVRHACAAAPVSATVVYDLRRSDPALAAAWQDALTQGYHRLEEALLCHALASVEDPAGSRPADADRAAKTPAPAVRRGHRQPGSGIADALTPASVQLALLLLNRHRATVEGKGKPMMSDKRRATAEETNAALTRKLDALASRLKIESGK